MTMHPTPLDKPLRKMLITDLLREYGKATLARSCSVNQMDDFIFWSSRLQALADESLRRDAEVLRRREQLAQIEERLRVREAESELTWQAYLDAQDASVRAQYGDPLERKEVIDAMAEQESPEMSAEIPCECGSTTFVYLLSGKRQCCVCRN